MRLGPELLSMDNCHGWMSIDDEKFDSSFVVNHLWDLNDENV
jgi:hypothetical protein